MKAVRFVCWEGLTARFFARAVNASAASCTAMTVKNFRATLISPKVMMFWIGVFKNEKSPRRRAGLTTFWASYDLTTVVICMNGNWRYLPAVTSLDVSICSYSEASVH